MTSVTTLGVLFVQTEQKHLPIINEFSAIKNQIKQYRQADCYEHLKYEFNAKVFFFFIEQFRIEAAQVFSEEDQLCNLKSERYI